VGGAEADMEDVERPVFTGGDSSIAGPGGSPAASSYGSLAGCHGSSAEVYCSVLQVAPGMLKESGYGRFNVTPWVRWLFFAHTYFVYIYVFFMFVLAFYKCYALEYPVWRRWAEMVLIMLIPCVQHLRFYFGHWGCELGLVYDLCAFLFLNAAAMLLLMYFLFLQAYIMPLDSSFLFVAIVLVIVESLCGLVNAMNAMKLRTLTRAQTIMMTASIISALVVFGLFVEQELAGKEALVDQSAMRWRGTPFPRLRTHGLPQ